VIEEGGSDRAVSLWSSPYLAASSILVYPESRAALASARRAGRLPGHRYSDSIIAIESRFTDLITVGVDEELARDAGAHAESLGLRGYDAVHLATALSLAEEEVTVVTWDRDLARAAEVTGLAVAGAA
jgi:uncharacterized protein